MSFVRVRVGKFKRAPKAKRIGKFKRAIKDGC